MSFIEYEDRKIKKNEVKKASKAYEMLEFKNLIFAGSVITPEAVEDAIGLKYEPNDWNFLGPYLFLKTTIESQGFFITQRDCEAPGFRILSSEEMADHAHRKLMNNLASNYKIAYTMAAHDTSKMNDSAKKKHKCVQNQAAQTALLQQKMLTDQKYF